MSDPRVSIVVVAYDMARELPRTLATLRRQTGVDAADYEVIVVDNGSPTPVPAEVLDGYDHGRLIRLDPAPSSPVRAANTGIAEARGSLIGLMIDGARMVTPGFVATAARAASMSPRAVVATLAFHLGSQTQMIAARHGYDQAAEDTLLATVDWEADGYRLFEISVLAGSSSRGWFGPMGESNGLFMGRQLWDELDGLDERFDLSGGGLANHDLYRRACGLADIELFVLLGESTFHQFHGGAATAGNGDREPWHQYERLRGEPYAVPDNAPTYVGTVPDSMLRHLDASLDWARERRA